MATDLLALLDRALDQTARVLDGAQGAAAAMATPCRSWDLQTLVDHVVFDLARFGATVRGEEVDWKATAPTAPADWAGAFRADAPGLLATWRDAGDLNQTVTRPFGEIPLSFLLNQQIAEFAVHAWDVATTTGQSVDWDVEVGQTALAWGGSALAGPMRGDEADGKVFGPLVDVPPGAPVYDRLAAFFGRTPTA